MAAPGLLKTKIDALKTKIAEKGSGLALEQRRRLTKRLKRLQRSRRTAMALLARASATGRKGKESASGDQSAAPTV